MRQGIREAEYYRTLYFTVVPPNRRAPRLSQLSRRSGQSQTESRGVTGPLQRAPPGGELGAGEAAARGRRWGGAASGGRRAGCGRAALGRGFSVGGAVGGRRCSGGAAGVTAGGGGRRAARASKRGCARFKQKL
ncbi:uncharacterized protein LOC131875290 [Cryptomeria japonica]|uniref:uncharacterized protein LOC131875290 n=1 Tax=Cryptomeria japonica TaxID=3369 RepID=UPI0027DA21A3|nr:uncharacterized protein LOC131875290 [Cryptomeria japonica]